MITINSIRDIHVWLDNAGLLAHLDAKETDRVVELLVDGEHRPAWGDDWTEYLDARAQALVLEVATTPDAVSLVHELLYAASQQGPEETDQVADRLLSAIHAERARHAEEVARLRAELADRRAHDEDVRTCLEYCDEDDPTPGGIGGLARELLKRFSGSEPARIPESEWTWYGHPLHFVGARTCLFRMGTKVGEYVVSTVGDWSIDGNSESRELGWGRKFETMVFRACGSHTECGCPDIDPKELECVGYNDAASAQAGHVEMCRKVAAGAFND